MKRLLVLFLVALLAAVGLAATPTSPQNGLFGAAIEDPSGLCAVVSHYNGFTVIEFSPPDQQAGFQSYDGEMVITSDTIYVSETEDDYTASYRIRYKAPFTAEGDIVFNGKSYKLKDSNTLNSFCNGSQTVFSKNIAPTGTPPPPPPVQPFTVTARASVTSGFAPLAVTFVAAASKPAAFVWRDNGVTFSTSPTPALTFMNPSTHIITVIATAGSETATGTMTISVQKKPSGGGNGSNGD